MRRAKKTLVYIKGGEISGNRAREGGGISLSNGAKAVLENCTITLCKETISSIGGGGMYANGATVKMTNCTLMGNEAEDSGGGIYTYKGGLTMTSCTLIGNRARTSGGGMTISDGIADIKDCSLRGNMAYFTDCAGGAIELKKSEIGSEVTISGGTIGGTGTNDANTTAVDGGGIYVGEDCKLTLKDSAQVIGNMAGVAGGGVYVSNSGTLEMKDSSCVTLSTGGDEDEPGKNDVYLENDAKITVAGELSPAGGTAARITVADDQYNSAKQVLDGDITAGTAPNQNYRKFTVTPKSGQNWEVDENGKLKEL